jgi:GNAT superfamily N-acetyltransferase
VTEPYDHQMFTLQEWDNAHPRWEEFVQCLEQSAPEQSPFVLGDYSRHLLCYLCVALQNEQVVGFLRFGIQPIGPEAHCPPLVLNGVPLTEAKIHAFAVREERRGQGIGTALQRWAIGRAKELGCFQLASYSSYGREANHHIKLSLGFGAQPEAHGDNQQGVYFIMPLQVDVLAVSAREIAQRDCRCP